MSVPSSERRTVSTVLGFELDGTGDIPSGWTGHPPETIHKDNTVIHSGSWSVRLERTSEVASGFSVLTKRLPVDFRGKTIELRGYLRTRDVDQWTGLWLREDGENGMIALDNMQSQAVSGSRDWREYSVSLPLDPQTTEIYFGVLLSGKGTAWADDLHLLVDGKPISDAPAMSTPPATALDRDREFDVGSHLTLSTLTPLQIDNLALLARVWGFLKYHHPVVTSGQRHWDYDLLRNLPSILEAPSRSAAQAVLTRWIETLGPLPACHPCAQLPPKKLALAPDLSWIHDRISLGEQLTRSLEQIEVQRPVSGQFYVSLVPHVGNPSFDHELSYPKLTFPDPGFQLVGLFRLWNMLQYWSPNRVVAAEDWPRVLREFIPQVALAPTKEAYSLAMLGLIARIHDSHSNLWSSLDLRPPVGPCRLPVNIRFIEDHAVVTTPTTSKAIPSPPIRRGDILQTIDGMEVDTLVSNWSPLYAASNQAARLRDIAVTITNGKCGPAKFAIRRNGALLQISADRVPIAGVDRVSYTHDLAGPTFRLLSPDVAYLKLSSIKATDVPRYLELAVQTKGIIVDIRNYPSDFVPFALGSHLVTASTPFATFTTADRSNPGAFFWGGESESIEPAQPHFEGKVLILVDEISQSQAEYTAMALRAAPRATIVGSTTAGADGNVSSIPLPGSLRTAISGLGVFFPDHRPTQRIGIIPDIEVRPTLKGIGEDRDEVLERAVREIVGPTVPEVEIRQLSRGDQP